MSFELMKLPYSRDALEPHMSAETLDFHHGKHHNAYVSKLNAALEGDKMADWELEKVLHEVAGDASRQGVFNNAAQIWNHDFLWHSLSPNGGGAPEGGLAQQIDADFGSLDDFKKAFKAEATGHFGSGWIWLVLEAGKLKVVSTHDADTPIVHGQQPLLTLDVWEHAFYIDFRNDKGSYVDTFLDKLVNWAFAAENFAGQGEGNAAAARRFNDAQEKFAAER